MPHDDGVTDRVGQPTATVSGLGGGTEPADHRLSVGRQLTFGRGRTVDIRFPEESRLSRLAGSIRALPDGVAVTNLSSTHDLYVRISSETMRLAATAPGDPVTSVLLGGGSATITWPGSNASSIRVSLCPSQPVEIASARAATGRSTFHPLSLNPLTKEFAVALFLCLPRLRAVPGETATLGVPELTRQILAGTHSFHLLQTFDAERQARTRLTNRTHEHLKSLRDKIIQAQLAPPGAALSPESVADLLVDHNVLRPRHLELLDDDAWLTQQEQNWER
jgi:hypothetical protein